MEDSTNRSTCMWVRPFTDWTNVHAKHFDACDSNEIATKIETKLGQARIYANNNRHSNKSRK